MRGNLRQDFLLTGSRALSFDGFIAAAGCSINRCTGWELQYLSEERPETIFK
jgi:hypothetical protein